MSTERGRKGMRFLARIILNTVVFVFLMLMFAAVVLFLSWIIGYLPDFMLRINL